MTRLAFFMPSLAGGGAERVTLDLCAGLVDQGDEVELWLGRAVGPLADDAVALSERVTTVDLGRARTVSALVPLSEMFGYVGDLRSKTSGQASYSMEFDSYAEVPSNVADEIIKKVRGE